MATGWFGAMPPPPGVEPNLVDPPSQMKQNIALHTVCLTLATLSVGVRLYTRMRLAGGKLGIEDYQSYSKGIGRHIWDTPATWIIDALKLRPFSYRSTCIKLTFLFLYRRIFSPQTIAKYFINGGIVTIFMCSPVARSWNSVLDGHCIDPKVLLCFPGVTSCITDIYILILPIPLLRRLNMGRKRRFRFAVIFGTGLFVCVASIVRLGMTPVLSSSFDATWNISNITVWGTLEANIGIVCACAMPFPAFFVRHLPEWAKLSVSRLSSYTQSFAVRDTKDSNNLLSNDQNTWLNYKNLSDTESGKLVIQKTDTFSMEDVVLPPRMPEPIARQI
ncbi:hypothetical protein F4811DRAFT_566168 [Daldinia bambusicola]|nr:hypothetical protein F4811DRAFT_566168 [Daldinia bambusicola]